MCLYTVQTLGRKNACVAGPPTVISSRPFSDLTAGRHTELKLHRQSLRHQNREGRGQIEREGDEGSGVGGEGCGVGTGLAEGGDRRNRTGKNREHVVNELSLIHISEPTRRA